MIAKLEKESKLGLGITVTSSKTVENKSLGDARNPLQVGVGEQ
jgi:hypothetical protein